jgi:hypothetical protein
VKRWTWIGLAAVGLLLFVSVMTTVVVAGAICSRLLHGRPGRDAPLFCEDGKPDAFVVVDRFNPAPGETTYNFSLYCMGARGETQEIGWFRPSAVLTLGHAVLYVALVGGVVLLVRSRARRRPRAVADAVADQVSDGT